MFKESSKMRYLIHHITSHSERKGEEDTLEAQIMEPTEPDQDGQQTIVGLLEERPVQDGQGEKV